MTKRRALLGLLVVVLLTALVFPQTPSRLREDQDTMRYPPCPSCAARYDFNHDGEISAPDLQLLVNALNGIIEPDSRFDLNCDGSVNGPDAYILAIVILTRP